MNHLSSALISCILLLLCSYYSFAQKETVALKLDSLITIDGKLDESTWTNAEVCNSFIQSSPNVGSLSNFQTEIRIAYNNNAVYFGITCFAPKEDISHVLSQRDELNSTIDYVAILLDTYNDDQNGFVFAVSSRGVQYDGKVFTGDWYAELNLAWHSATKITDSSWTAEIKIPYSALRFPNLKEQTWGINFIRYVASKRETSSWNPMRPDFNNDMAQCGTLTGISSIEPPLRLSFSPYVSGYIEHSPDYLNPAKSWSYSVNGGMDLKYGINEAFTIDMTLVPDFGQVQFDNQVLNLSPFEVRFNDYRPFFTEGTELFNKADLFYSRRIGGFPINYSAPYQSLDSNELVVENPSIPQLLNALKFSGRTKKGLGIGIFNAISGESHAIIQDTVTGENRKILTNPLTNYNVAVFDKSLKNNSYLNFTNTNVTRSGSSYDANVSSLFGKLNSKTNKYYAFGKAVVSQLYFSDSTSLGHNLQAEIGKQTGQFTYNLGYSEMSDTYNPNDLGYLSNNNIRQISSNFRYNIYKPFWRLNRLWSGVNLTYKRLFAPNSFVALNTSGNIGVTDKRFHTYGFDFEFRPTRHVDFFEPRQHGQYFVRPTYFSGGFWVSTNYQKRLALDASAYYSDIAGSGWNTLYMNFSPRFRINNTMFLVLSVDNQFTNEERGKAIPNQSISTDPNVNIFGKRSGHTTVNTINYTFTLTNRSGISFRLRHYWAAIYYKSFYALNPDGSLSDLAYSGTDNSGKSTYNTNFNAFTIDFVYRWIFAPASELNVVWKNAIFKSDDQTSLTYFQNLNAIFDYGAINSFSLRVVYYLDAANLKRKRIKKG